MLCKITITLLLTGWVSAAHPLSLRAESFHNGGAGACSGCHIAHSPESGPAQMLLQANDPSSICLNCHAGAGGPNSHSIFSPNGSALTPGGDFYWLTRTFSWVDGQSPGYGHGHSIVAGDFSLGPDPVLLQAPGGTYPSARLGCTSCHDPHGQVGGGTGQGGQAVSGTGSYGDIPLAGSVSGNYRLLGSSGYNAGGSLLDFSFSNGAPVARQSSVNRYAESDTSHVAYGAGMSEWCGNCHGAILANAHNSVETSFNHPAGNDANLDLDIVGMYNSYLRTGDFAGITETAYLQFVPFELGISNQGLLDPNSTKGPDGNSNVMCLTCHRAHASAFANSGRWDFSAQLLVQSHPAIGDAGATASDVNYSYYGRDIALEFGSGQAQFCEKCHGTTLP